MLLIVFPVAGVLRSIDVFVTAESVGFVIGPKAVIDVTIRVNKQPVSVGLVQFPLSRVACTIWPDLFASTVPEAPLPFACVLSSGLELVG